MSSADALPTPPFSAPCVIYKPLRTFGGLEIYAAELAALLDVPVYTATQSTRLALDDAPPEIREFGTDGWFRRVLDRLPVGTLVETIEYESFAVPDEHDAVITIGEVAKAVIHRPDQRRYHLLNMPPRWLFDQAPGRFDPGRPAGWLRSVYQAALRTHDLSTMARLNDVVVPSETIGRRLRTYYHRTPTATIYPPIRTDRYSTEPGAGYLLYLGRLTSNKRVGELVDALSGTDHQVKVAGTGPLESELRARAGDNIEVLGFVSESRKLDLLAHCDALLFNSEAEAFGIVPVEAFASGKPVVGVRDGFTEHQITDGENGILFDRGDGAIERAVARMYATEWDPAAIRESAARYDIDRFRDAWRSLLGP